MTILAIGFFWDFLSFKVALFLRKWLLLIFLSELSHKTTPRSSSEVKYSKTSRSSCLARLDRGAAKQRSGFFYRNAAFAPRFAAPPRELLFMRKPLIFL
jgi:hypothetical protein